MHKLKHRTSDEQGFTLIELLVAILIIGILAAIVLPSALPNKKLGQDKAAQTELRHGVSEMTACFKKHGGDYRLCLKPFGTSTRTDLPPYTDAAPTKLGYKLIVNSKSGNKFWVLRHSDGSFTRRCTQVGEGLCRPIGGW